MITLILTLALAIRAVVCAIGAVASVAKILPGDGLLEAVRTRPSRFPAISLLDPLAGKTFSLLARSGKLAQRIDLTKKYRSERADFRVETKNFPAFSRLAGKIAGSEHAEPHDPVDRVEAGQDALADQVAQGLGGAAAEGPVAGAAVEARHREFVGEAVAAISSKIAPPIVWYLPVTAKPGMPFSTNMQPMPARPGILVSAS
jgi:hypothetical protein